jgi:hypothetical protein
MSAHDHDRIRDAFHRAYGDRYRRPGLEERVMATATDRRRRDRHQTSGPLVAAAVLATVLAVVAVGTLLFLGRMGRPQPAPAGSPGPVVSASPSETPSVAPSASPSAVPAAIQNAIPGSSRTFTLRVSLSGALNGTLTRATPLAAGSNGSGLLCQQSGAPVLTILRGDVNGQAIDLTIGVSQASPGTHQAMIVLVPPAGLAAPVPSGPFGADVPAWSTSQGSAAVAADGMSIEFQGDLGREHVAGSWTCQGAQATQLQACRSSQLSVQPGRVGVALGHAGVVFTFQNRSAVTCTLYGFPGLQMLDAQGRPIPTRVDWGSDYIVQPEKPALVTLRPGDQASFLLGYSDPANANLTCPASSQLEVTPPNETQSLVIAFQLAPAEPDADGLHLQCGRVTVSPVYAGTGDQPRS